MKKFLLSIALLAAGATIMNAASFEISVNGTKVEDGAKITHNTIEQNMPEYGMLGMLPTIALTNTASTSAEYKISATAVSIASAIDENANLQFCVGMDCKFIDKVEATVESQLTVAAGATEAEAIHITYVPVCEFDENNAISKSYNGTSEYTFTVTSGSDTMTFTIVFEYNGGTDGIYGIEFDNNATPEYFNLQGVKVANPDKGIYIVRRGNKVSKEFVK